MLRSLLAVLVVALAAIAPAAARAQDGPTLSFDMPCYSPGDRMEFSGAGYTPGGSVRLGFNTLAPESEIGTFDTLADEGGAIADWIQTPDPDDILQSTVFSGMLGVAAVDQIRIEAGTEPEHQSSPKTSFRLSRWEVQLAQPNGARVRAAKPMRVTAVGYTHAIGKHLYVHYTRAGKRLKTVKLGRLGGDCGDRQKRLPRALPRGLRPGRYELDFNHSAMNAPRTPGLWHKLRLR